MRAGSRTSSCLRVKATQRQEASVAKVGRAKTAAFVFFKTLVKLIMAAFKDPEAMLYQWDIKFKISDYTDNHWM